MCVPSLSLSLSLCKCLSLPSEPSSPTLSYSLSLLPGLGSLAYPTKHEGASRECIRVLQPLILVPEALPRSKK